MIGAGLPRTGTTSMLEALRILYGVPGYHMTTVLKNNTSAFWIAMERGTPTLNDIQAHFDGYAHAQDAPSIFFWQKLSQAYPDAKIVMTTREFETWYRSVNDTIGRLFSGNPERSLGIRIVQALLLRRHTEMVKCTWTHNPKYLNGDLSKENFKLFHS